MLDPEYFVKLLNFISTTGKKRRADERNVALEERREAYKNKNWDRYREIIGEQFEKEDRMAQSVLRDVLDNLTGTSEQEFQMTMQMMSQHPQYQQMIMAAQ